MSGVVAPFAAVRFIDPATGFLTEFGVGVMTGLVSRTGGTGAGMNTADGVAMSETLSILLSDAPDARGDTVPTDDAPDVPDLGAASLVAMMLGDVA